MDLYQIQNQDSKPVSHNNDTRAIMMKYRYCDVFCSTKDVAEHILNAKDKVTIHFSMPHLRCISAPLLMPITAQIVQNIVVMTP